MFEKRKNTNVLSRIIILSALGYFVDILDLFLFSVLRVPSLRDLGISQADLMPLGIRLLNAQMAGLLIGGFLWGVSGDKWGRVRTLYCSILLYSLATLANAFIHDFNSYYLLRFLSGVGLSGELGAAITLVSESMEAKKRGWGTTLVAGIGLCGGIVAALMAEFLGWRTCYAIGGIAGLILCGLRFKLHEPAIFLEMNSNVQRGSLLMLVRSPLRFMRLVNLVLIGVPIWFVSGILMIFSPEFGRSLGLVGEVSAGQAILYSYFGVAIGDFISGALSQYFSSRKKIIFVSLLFLVLGAGLYLNAVNFSRASFYGICFVLGLATGYWAVLVTLAAESFGTNMRATITTLVPNLIRASVIPMTFIFQFFNNRYGLIPSAMTVGIFVVLIALLALIRIPESFAKDLSFLED